MEQVKFNSIDGIELDGTIELVAVDAPWILLVHGITATKDEGGMYTRLSDGLARAGFNSLRFSFRGHGQSGGSARGVTIAGEQLDFEAALNFMLQKNRSSVRPVVLASSFGAVALCLSLPYLESRLSGYVLWNPVLDLKRTFVLPELPWQVANFGVRAENQIREVGYVTVDGSFQIGRVMFNEFSLYDPLESFENSGGHCLIVHGDKDDSVSYSIAEAAANVKKCEFVTISGSDHGFDGEDFEAKAIGASIEWIKRRLQA